MIDAGEVTLRAGLPLGTCLGILDRICDRGLVDHGVAGERLKSEGFGPTKPICTEKTAACYDKNRRTQFLVTHQ